MATVTTQRYPKVDEYTLTGGTSHTTTFTPPARFCQIYNRSSNHQAVLVTLNGDTAGATFTLDGGEGKVFNWGDLYLDSVKVSTQGISGALSADIQIISGQAL